MKPADNAFAREAIEAKGWWGAHRWLVLRRLVQLSVLALFLIGPWFGWWIVKGNLNYSLTLETDAVTLSDVVVTAYGTTRKEALTGSVGSIKSEAIALRPVNNITNVIEGSSPGVITSTANGQPGSGLDIRIRGFGSINATQEPLYVVDGVPYVGGTSNINPDDVESISILKDASATALYGSRAANGVVMITTKRGKKGRKPICGNIIRNIC